MVNYKPYAHLAKVLLFCGAFDPISSGHLLMLQLCIKTAFFDEIRIMPSGVRTDKQYKTTDEHRKNMCELAIDVFKQEDPNLNITFCDYEMNLKEPQDSYFTVKHFTETEPEKVFFFFLGSDILNQMFTWPYSRELVSIANFLIVYREGYPIKHELLENLNSYELLDLLLYDKGQHSESSPASSTEVRTLLNGGKKVGDVLLHPRIMEYVEKNQLYNYKPNGTTSS